MKNEAIHDVPRHTPLGYDGITEGAEVGIAVQLGRRSLKMAKEG